MHCIIQSNRECVEENLCHRRGEKGGKKIMKEAFSCLPPICTTTPPLKQDRDRGSDCRRAVNVSSGEGSTPAPSGRESLIGERNEEEKERNLQFSCFWRIWRSATGILLRIFLLPDFCARTEFLFYDPLSRQSLNAFLNERGASTTTPWHGVIVAMLVTFQ